MTQKRISWIDLCKGYAIILVILGHSYSSNNCLLTWINSFHMPLFFMLSGILICIRRVYERSFKKVVCRNMQSLLLPYFVYSIALTVFVTFLRTHGGPGFVSGVATGVKYIIVLYGNSPMWFLPCLFLAEIIVILLHRLPNKIRFLIAFSSMIIGVWAPHEILLMSLLCRVLRAVFFMIIGEMLLLLYSEKIKHLFILLAGIHVYLSQWNGSAAEMGNSKFVYIICAVVGSVATILLFWGFLKEAHCKWLEFFGTNTLTVLCTHPFIIELIRLFDYKVSGGILATLGNFEGLIMTLIVCLVEIPVICFINKYIPVLGGKKRIVEFK